MIDIELTINNGFRWYHENDCWVKGAISDLDGNQLNSKQVFQILTEVENIYDFKQVICNLRGIFSIVYKCNSKVFVATDITRTFPLFYICDSDEIKIKDNIWSFSKLERGARSNTAKKEFLCSGYTINSRTIYKSIKQTQSAEIIEFTNTIKSFEYWNYLDLSPNDSSFKYLQTEAIKLIEDSTKRLVNSLQNKTALVPLSGGFDSRLILASLKNHGFKNVQCFTYGDPKSKDLKIAKKIAKKLGYQIHTVSLDTKFIQKEFNLGSIKKYMRFAFNGVSVPHLQDFLAVKYLHDNKLIPNDSVFIPGHSGDLFAGTHIMYLDDNSSKKDAIAAIIKKHFWLSSHDGDWSINYNNKASPSSNMENWSWKERQAKFIINSIRTYDYFGYESRVPLWDQDLASFFRNIPLEFKNRRNKKTYSIQSNLYDSVCQTIFIKAGLSIINRSQDLFFTRVLRRISSLIFGVDGVNNLNFLVKLFSQNEKIKFKSLRPNGCLAELQLFYIDQYEKNLF